jgi:Zn ribbon nucleic-acid-binding protein
MPAITKAKIRLLMLEAMAIYCPRCSSRPGSANNMTGWDKKRPWKRECFNCGYTWTDTRLKKILK